MKPNQIKVLALVSLLSGSFTALYIHQKFEVSSKSDGYCLVDDARDPDCVPKGFIQECNYILEPCDLKADNKPLRGSGRIGNEDSKGSGRTLTIPGSLLV